MKRTPRPLWPWVVAAAVLCLFAAGFSFWWPMYRTNQLITKIREQGGRFENKRPGTTWQHLFGLQFHPWFHEVASVDMNHRPNEILPLSDKDIVVISKLKGIRSLTLSLADNSPAAVDELQHLTDIEYLTISGEGGSISTDWIRTLPRLSTITLMQSHIAAADWENLVTSNAKLLAVYDCTADVQPLKSSTVTQVYLGGLRLDGPFAKALVDLPLAELQIHTCRTENDFWKELSAHPTLRQLTIIDTTSSQASVEYLSHLPKLTALQFRQADLKTMGLDQRQIRSLGQLHQLRSLSFLNLDVPTEGCWESVATMPSLTTLMMIECDVDDAVMTALTKSSCLESIWINSTRVTDAGLLKLSELPTLKEVHIADSHFSSTMISAGGEAEFVKARSDVALVK